MSHEPTHDWQSGQSCLPARRRARKAPPNDGGGWSQRCEPKALENVTPIRRPLVGPARQPTRFAHGRPAGEYLVLVLYPTNIGVGDRRSSG